MIATQFHKIAIGVSDIEAPHGSMCAMPLNDVSQELDSFGH